MPIKDQRFVLTPEPRKRRKREEKTIEHTVEIEPRAHCKGFPLVSVVVSTHNRTLAVERCVESILRSNYPALEVIVVDDCSNDGTYERLSEKFPGLILIRNEREIFLAGSRNVGCRKARGSFVFLLDDDNVVHPDTISELIAGLKRPEWGIAGPIMYYLACPKRIWCCGIARHRMSSLTRFLTVRPVESWDEPYFTNDLPNALMVRRTVFDQIGYFDDLNFPIHLDEADFCRRAKSRGISTVVVPRASLWHDIPIRSLGSRRLRSLHLVSPRRAYYLARNRIVFMRKYAGARNFSIFVTFFLPLITAAYLASIIASKGPSVTKTYLIQAYSRGVFDGIRAKTGQ